MDPNIPPGEAPPDDIVMQEDEGQTPSAGPPVDAVERAMVESAVTSAGTEEDWQQHQQPPPGDGIMHAMTPEGLAVSITFDPESGQYVTASGDPVVIQMEGGDKTGAEGATGAGVGEEAASGQGVEQMDQDPSGEELLPTLPKSTGPDAPQQMDGVASGLASQPPDETMSDLSSLAAAAEAHSASSVAEENAEQQQMLEVPTVPGETIRIPVSETQQPTQVRIVTSEAAIAASPDQQQQQIRIVNADGTVSTLGNVRPSPVQQAPSPAATATAAPPGGTGATAQQQIRIVKLDGAKIEQQQQIRIVNADGSLSSLSANNIRVVSGQQGPKQIRVVRTSSSSSSGGPASPAKALTLAQAQQLGLLASPTRPQQIKSIRLSPNKDVRQLVIRGGQATAGGSGASGGPRLIQIPAAGLQAGSIQQIQVGNKVQYVRVMGSTQAKGSSTSSTSPIPLSALKGVKIAIPPSKPPAGPPRQRAILPQGASIKPIPVEKGQVQIHAVGEVGKAATDSASSSSATEGMGTAYEHFLAKKKEEEPSSRPTAPAPAGRTIKRELSLGSSGADDAPSSGFEASGVRPRKPCNCTKSQCLKLYCDCFANGEFCNNCNCNNCFNNLAHEEERQKAIKQCLDRNVNAFKPKIGRAAGDGERRHNKGCNCKRSGCLKNYCECYEAKIPCTDACRCLGCKNVEEETGRKKELIRNTLNGSVQLSGTVASAAVAAASAASLAHRQQQHLGQQQQQLQGLQLPSGIQPLLDAAEAAAANSPDAPGATKAPFSLRSKLSPKLGAGAKGGGGATGQAGSSAHGRQPFSFITPEVVEATCQCLLAQAEESERSSTAEADTEALILEEFGRCLVQIIGFANKSKAATSNGGGPAAAASLPT